MNERKKLQKLIAKLSKPVWDLSAICHLEQLRLVTDTAKTVAGCAGRRSGKSQAAAIKGIDVCLGTPGINALYIAATRQSAKEMVWEPIKRLNRDFQLGGKPNSSDLSITFPNGSKFTIRGVDSIDLADKVRGIPKLVWVCVDEAQRYKPDVLNYLLKDVLRAGLLDGLEAAQMWILGTPNPMGKSGAFWERWSSPSTSTHHFTIFDNDKLGTLEQITRAVDEILKEEKETKDSPWYQTEILAVWGVVDSAEQVYRYNDALNTYETLPELTHFIICADVGITAADAVGVLGWQDDDPTIYLVSEHIKTGQTDLDLGLVLFDYYQAYDPILIVVDAGGGGAKTLATLKQLYPDLPIEAMSKPAINLQIKALNGPLASGRFKVKANSTFAAEIRQIGWVNGVVNGKVDETTLHSDIIPAVRGGVLAAIPFLPALKTPQTIEQEALEAAEEARKARFKKAAQTAKTIKRKSDDDTVWSPEEDTTWLAEEGW